MTVAELTAIADDQLKAANARRTMRRDALSDFAVDSGCDVHVVSAADYMTKE